MALPFDDHVSPRDPRALAILAKTIFRELRQSGYSEKDVIAFAGELLGVVTTEVKGRRAAPDARNGRAQRPSVPRSRAACPTFTS